MVIVKHGLRPIVSFGFIAGLIAAGCNVSATAGSTGGVCASGETIARDAGSSCDEGTVVLLTDYMSTQIALAHVDGTTISPAFLSTASTKASGLAFALSGDVALPNVTPASGRVVLLDRFGTNVVTWADPCDAKVLGQLPVGTGFESNPQDYLETDATHAYVSRWGVNDAPGKQPFDTGNDVLVVTTPQGKTPPAIVKSIQMPVENMLPPRASGMARVGGTVIAVLQFTSEDFKTVGDSSIVGIANDAIAWEVHLTGLKNCGRPAVSPSGKAIALGCEGQLDMNGNPVDLAASAIALLDASALPPKVTKTYAISDQLGSPPQNQVAFASETLLFAKTQTPLGGIKNNQALSLDLTSGKATALVTASADAHGMGKGVVYGDILCRPGCGDICLMADADVGKLRRWSIGAGALTPLSEVTVETMTGLPPVSLAGY
jgi:hypothetical protein